MSRAQIPRRRIIATACLASLTGCSLLPSSPAPQMYRLSPADLDPTDAPAPRASLAIGMPTASEDLDSDRIALTRGATRFDYFADATWTDRVPALLRTSLLEAFETDGRIADVWTDPNPMAASYLLETVVRAFTARYDSAVTAAPVVEVSLDLRLVRLPGHETAGRALITEHDAAARNELRSIVQAFDVATGKVLNRCVTWTFSGIQHSPHHG
jgi:cholesterol transport system auxiliary component